MRTLSLASLVLALAAGPAFAGSSAHYSVTFDGTWSAATHPLEFPGNAHFSGLVGATHNGAYKIFEAGGTATPGLENLSEKGAHNPLADEIRAAIAAGKAGALFEGAPIFGPPGQATSELEIDPEHPMVSVVAMVAPSPDWFAGAMDVVLQENGEWVESKTVTLYAWDAGTDSGASYQDPDADMQPRGPVGLNDSPHFVKDGARVPVATVTFTRK